MNIYETDRLLAEYLLFHYGEPAEVLPYPNGPTAALGYPQRCVSECLDFGSLPANARALDLGCAVGRSTFELARHCSEVIGIDFSHRFIEAAQQLQVSGSMSYERRDEGDFTTPLLARIPEEIDRSRVRFETGDAQALREDLGTFDVVVMANLIDRLNDPAQCLDRLARLVRPGGQLIVTSPYTWMEDFTPRERWLGGTVHDGKRVTTHEGLVAHLGQYFILAQTKNLPFLIREHARKFQWSVAEATLWHRSSLMV